jgi:hypothetical protein
LFFRPNIRNSFDSEDSTQGNKLYQRLEGNTPRELLPEDQQPMANGRSIARKLSLSSKSARHALKEEIASQQLGGGVAVVDNQEETKTPKNEFVYLTFFMTFPSTCLHFSIAQEQTCPTE